MFKAIFTPALKFYTSSARNAHDISHFPTIVF